MQNKAKSIGVVCGALLAVSACTGTNVLPDDPFAGQGQALTMVPINHTDRYADSIFVDKYGAGNVSAYSGGGKAACCYAGVKNWNQPVTVTVLWGRTEDPVTRVVTVPNITKTYTAHFPGSPRRNDDMAQDESNLCVILRNFDEVELAFSKSRGACADK